MDRPGFTGGFVDIAPGNAMPNADMPVVFDAVERRTSIQSRQIVRAHENVETIAHDVIDALFAKLGINENGCGGLVLASCTYDHRGDALSTIADRIALKRGIQGPHSGVDYACSGFPAATASFAAGAGR